MKKNINSLTKDLLKNLLMKDENKRFNITQVLQHPALKMANQNSGKISESDFQVLM